jgi:nucleoside-diphosphate-sugar epimerase
MQEKELVFVTGGTGLIGAHLLFDLVSRGYHVRALRRHGSNTERVRRVFSYYHSDPDRLFAEIEWHVGDLDNTTAWEGALEGIRHFYHCAAVVSLDSGSAEALTAANVGGTQRILEQCRKAGVEKLCYVSSSSALGKPATQHGIVTEDTPWDAEEDISPYAASKYAAEQAVWQAIREGLNAVIVNPVIVLGPGDWDRSSAKIIQTVWKGFPFYTQGVNGFVDVRDVSRAMIGLTEGPWSAERFILSSESLAFRQVFGQIAASLGKRGPFIPVPRLAGEIAWRANLLTSKISGKAPVITKATVASADKQYFFSNEKVKKALQLDFIPIEKSVKDTCEIFLAER